MKYAIGDRVIIHNDESPDEQGRPPCRVGCVVGFVVRFPGHRDTFIVDDSEIQLSGVDALAGILSDDRANLADVLDTDDIDAAGEAIADSWRARQS